jgi:hypothetical protein
MADEEWMAKAIEQAKKWVLKTGQVETERQWLSGEPLLPYGDSINHKVQLSILEGTPQQGIIVADYGRGRVWGININRQTKLFRGDIAPM